VSGPAVAAGAVLALAALAHAPPALAQADAPPKAVFAAGDALDVDLTYNSRWEAMNYIDPLKLSARLRLEVADAADFPAAGAAHAPPEGSLRFVGRLEARRVDYERPDRRWTLSPTSIAGMNAVADGLRASAAAPPPEVVKRMAIAEELLGAAAMAARGRPFAIVLPPHGPATIASLDGLPLAPGLPAGADAVLSGFLAGAARFVVPERAEVVVTTTTKGAREIDPGTAEFYALHGLSASAAESRPVPASRITARTRAVDGLTMRVSGIVPAAKGGRAEVTEASSGTDASAAVGLAAFGLFGTLGAPPELRRDIVETGASMAGAASEAERRAERRARDPLDITIRFREGDRRVSAAGKLVANEALGFAVRRTLAIDETLTGVYAGTSQDRIRVESRVTWSSVLVSARIGKGPAAKKKPAPRTPLVEP